MADYTFPPAVVLLEETGELAIGATGVLRPTAGGDPVPVYDLNDSPLASVLVGPKGAHQAFKADIPHGVLDFGSVLLPATSQEQEEAALVAVETANEALTVAQAALDSYSPAGAIAAVQEAALVSPTGQWDFDQAPTVDGLPIGGGSGDLVEGENITLTPGPEPGQTTISASAPGLAEIEIGDLPARSLLVWFKPGAVWDDRPSNRTDISFFVVGPDRPPTVSAPAVNGMYTVDIYWAI